MTTLLKQTSLSDNLKSSCVGTYALKLVNDDYTGSILTIQRHTDEVLINFKANINGNLFTYDNGDIYMDNISIEVVLSSTGDSGYIYKLWDQSNNNNHLIQENINNQPLIDLTTKNIIFNGNSYLYRIPGLLSDGIPRYCYAVNFLSFTNSASTICEHNSNTFMAYQRGALCVDNTICFKGGLDDGITSYSIVPYNNYSAIMCIDNLSPFEGNHNLKIRINGTDILTNTGDGPGYQYLYLNNYGFSVGINLSTLSTEYFNGIINSIYIFNNTISDEDMIIFNDYQMNNLT